MTRIMAAAVLIVESGLALHAMAPEFRNGLIGVASLRDQ